ncbi:MAG: hypothetical protein WBI07_12105, partial [Mobilitalea sp.]
KQISVKSTRFLSICDVHTAAIRYEIQSLQAEYELIFEAGMNAEVSNQPIEDDQTKQNEDILKMITVVESLHDDPIGMLKVKTVGKADIHIAEGFSLESSEKDIENRIDTKQEEYIGKEITLSAKAGKKYIFDKIISVFSSRECAKEALNEILLEHLKQNRLLGYDTLYASNAAAWSDKWKNSDIELHGDDKLQTALRYNIFQLIQTNSERDNTVNIGARGIMHSRYKGCYFWDTDIFMLPFYIHTNPAAAKNLVMYRYLKLPDARLNAKELNLKGARYPWMCSIDGREQCESWDIGKSEIHITADVVYAVDYYVQMTGDMEFYTDQAVEIYLEAASYHESRLTYEEKEDRYNLLFVKGPDEYCGITSNNTYSNWLIRYNLKLAIEGLDYLKQHCTVKYEELKEKLGIKESYISKWLDIIAKIKIPYEEQENLYLQDDTFMKLEKLTINSLKTNGVPLYQTICFDRLQRYQVLKQADFLLLLTLRPTDFTQKQKLAAWNYYEPLTLHDSSLSYGVHANLAAQLGIEDKAIEYFEKSVLLDLEDIMSTTGKEGLHYAAFGATWQAIIQGFAGIQVNSDTVTANPHLPASWKKLKFRYRLNSIAYQIEILNNEVSITKLKEAESSDTKN